MSENKLIKNSIIVIILTLVGKVLGFVRDAIVASKFGASYATDIYMFSTGMVLLLFTGISTSLGTSFIPMLTNYNENKSKEETNNFVNNTLNFTLLIVTFITIGSIVFGYFIVYFFAPGFKQDITVFTEAVKVSKVMFISLIFIAIQNIMSGVLQAHKKFSITSAIFIYSNMVLIIYLYIFGKKYGMVGLAVATVISCIVQFMMQIPSYKKLGYKYKLILNFKDNGLKKLIMLMIPVILGTSVSQINLAVDRILATTVGEGAISVLGFANKINMLIYGVFAYAVAIVIFPSLSIYSAQDNKAGYKKALGNAVNAMLLIMIPATVAVMVLRTPIINVLFKRGAFDDKATYLTSLALLFYSPGMLAYGINDIFCRAFYSVRDTKTPMINSIIGMVLNIILNIVLVRYLKTAGLALGTSISAIITTVFLVRSLKNKVEDIGLEKMAISFLKISAASLIMALVIYFINRSITINFGIQPNSNLLSLVSCLIIGGLVYYLCVYLLKVEEFIYMHNVAKKYLHSKFTK